MPEADSIAHESLSDADQLRTLGAALGARAARSFHRACVVLWGPQNWGHGCAELIIDGFGASDVLRLHHGTADDGQGPGLAYRDYKTVLGSEFDGLILDLHHDFSADAFGALTGIVRGGGVLICLMPILHHGTNTQRASRLAIHPYGSDDVTRYFPTRIAQGLRSADGVIHLHADDQRLTIEEEESGPFVPRSLDQLYHSDDQRIAVEKIIKVVRGRSRRPLVLTADRGRGKSAALGIAAAQLLAAGPCRICVIAPSARSVASVFKLAASVLKLSSAAPNRIETEHGWVSYMAPAELVEGLPDADLILVDEAAALPTELLKRLLLHARRIVFASTVHGYEGTGQGFGIRFRSILDEHCPDWRAFEMHTPVRWAPDDPVEALTFDALLLACEPGEWVEPSSYSPSGLVIESVEKEALAADESLLKQVYGLLIAAHYRTSPADLERMLDAPHLKVWLARSGGVVVGTALVASEGGFGSDMADSINRGERRPPGHLLPEALAVHCGLERAPMLKAERIVRIATHPKLRRQGVATHILEAVQADACERNIDYLGASFGATQALVAFWHQAGFEPVRVGVKRGASSGLFSTVVMRPLSTHGDALQSRGRTRFHKLFPLLLREQLRHLQPDLVLSILRGGTTAVKLNELSDEDWSDVVGFAAGAKSYESCLIGLNRFFSLTEVLQSDRFDEESAAHLMIRKVFQAWPWAEVAADGGLSGRRTVHNALVDLLRQLLVDVELPSVQKLLLRYGLD